MNSARPTVNAIDKAIVEGTVKEYRSFHDDKKTNKEERVAGYAKMIDHYYNLATDFYEWGWGQSFHFATQYKNEAFHASLARHEHYLALRLSLQKGWKVLDVGCGVGGPARNIARLSGSNIVGITINQYQVDRGNLLNAQQGLSELVHLVQGDFMKLPFEDSSFDAAYQIEATAHAPDKAACYREVYRVLKPGQYFVGYEWCLTDLYDPENPEHRQIKKGIEEGDALPDIATIPHVLESLEKAGFEVVDFDDLAKNHRPAFEYPWYLYLTPGWSPSRFQFHPVGRCLFSRCLRILEWFHVVPKGTSGVSSFLNIAADALAKGGQLGVFTPMFFYLVRKPLKEAATDE